MKQSTQNVELTNYTEAMYSARESAMEKMQRSALAVGGQGVVEVKVTEGPMSFARHAVGFTAWGTALYVWTGALYVAQVVITVRRPRDQGTRPVG